MNAPISSSRNTTAGSSAASSTRQSPANVAQAAAPAPAPAPAQIKTPSTDALLKDFTLVAEAAKRAQVAVMVRDFESCGI
ncbi:Putative thiol methyltransferase 2 [Tolypocladium paradoxum]|uniref:Thiol methyltransferase 2 n=1 Tax=Tolypocladium paradoxum TaxID=94208 RepID=A0A2S4L839_9HYPO|nr:Putative thiol methyltransferase 2 [Tolypocladium paradoxum]